MQPIGITEKKLIAEIINLGYKRAANSFSSLTGQNISIENADFDLCTDHNYLIENFGHLKDLTVVQTDVVGQLDGAGYLIFNAEERRVISNMSLVAFASSTSLEETIILKEIDNIISASVITELSNALNIRIHGDVPRLFQVDNIREFHNAIREGNDDYYFLARSNFIFENHGMISPVFIWKMDKKLLSMINK
ncbi:hypothetical protein QQ020_11630 [Fulvivirgaceae bacterium BMA12]|uniref:Uncharacterized protein n=1 Tax=Agaribacillus aureus TaxID=3051825 RepID=A0ABT8L4P9_9BACT|nr:hypothetical protein [Fulvivirgaceae bacterium BMA12]